MAALAFENIIPTHYYIRLDSSVTGYETVHAPVLDALRVRTQAQTAVIYAFHLEAPEVSGIAARSDVEARLKDVGATLSSATSRWLETLAEVAQGIPGQELNFERFPETLHYHVRRLAVVPLRVEDRVLGLLTLGRNGDAPFTSPDLELASRFGKLFTAVLERDLLQQQLIERKLIERAKGILQHRRRLSEERAYLLLRNNSRRRRISMAHLAKEIIEVHTQTGETANA